MLLPPWRWHHLGSFFLSALQAALQPGFKSTAQMSVSYYSALTEFCSVEAVFYVMPNLQRWELQKQSPCVKGQFQRSTLALSGAQLPVHQDGGGGCHLSVCLGFLNVGSTWPLPLNIIFYTNNPHPQDFCSKCKKLLWVLFMDGAFLVLHSRSSEGAPAPESADLRIPVYLVLLMFLPGPICQSSSCLRWVFTAHTVASYRWEWKFWYWGLWHGEDGNVASSTAVLNLPKACDPFTQQLMLRDEITKVFYCYFLKTVILLLLWTIM